MPIYLGGNNITGGFTTEEKRQFNNSINLINEQMNTKANKEDLDSKIWSMDNMGQDIKEAMAGQVTRDRLSNVICGRDFEVNQTKAYPGISCTVNNAPKGKNITIKCKITIKNTMNGIRFTYSYGSAYQDNNFVDKPLLNVEKVYEHTWENTSDRVITSFFIGVNSNSSSANLNALIKEVRLYIDGKEHFDFDMQNDTGLTDLTDYNYTLASRKFIKDAIGSLNTDVTVTKLDSSIFGKKYEVSGFTYAYPKVYLVKFKQQYPSGNIKFSFKVTPKNRMDYVKITTNAWQSPEYQIRVIYPNETTLIEGSIAPTREFDMLGISLSTSSPTACLDGIYEDFIIKIDDNIVDFEMATASINEEEGKTIVDVSEEQYLVASKLYVKEHTDKSIEALQDNFKHGDKTIHYNALNEDIVGNCFYIHKISAYPGIKFNLNLKINQGQRVQLVYKAKIIEGNTGHHCTFNYGGSYSTLQCNATEIGKVQEVKSNVMEFSADKTITMVSIAKNSNNPNTTCHQYIYDPCVVVDGVRYPLTEGMLKEDSDALTLQSIKEEVPILATKKFVEDSINTALNGIEKREFVLPFVNNLYVVQGSKRKQSVPIFIDYLYNGNKDKILFENGEDRAYIREAILSPNSQSANILNTKETLKFKSETLNVSDVTFNKISIEEKTPNGKIRLLTIGDSVTAGAITEKQYWAVARELFALEDIDRKRNSDVMFLGSNNVRNTTINYNGVEKQVKSCACGISSWSLNHWLTNSSSHFVYDNNGTPTFSILKWIERYRTHLDDGTKLELGDSRLGTEITSSNIDNIQCCTPNIVYINSTHNGGTIEQHEQMIEIIQREIPGCKIIVGSPMPLTGTWHKEKYVGKDWLDDEGCITGPNYSWGGGYGTSRIESLNYYTQRERENADNTFYFMPQVVTMPTVESLEYDLVDCGVKMMKQPTKVNQLPKEHPSTLTHKIWGYELYALLKYISGIEQGVTNNFDTVPLFN